MINTLRRCVIWPVWPLSGAARRRRIPTTSRALVNGATPTEEHGGNPVGDAVDAHPEEPGEPVEHDRRGPDQDPSLAGAQPAEDGGGGVVGGDGRAGVERPVRSRQRAPQRRVVETAHVHAAGREPLALGGELLVRHRQRVPTEQPMGVDGDRRPHAGRQDVDGAHVGGVELEIVLQRLGEAAHGELRRGVGGDRPAVAERGPHAVDAADVDDRRRRCSLQQREERPRRAVQTTPGDVERPLPLLGRIGDEALAAADAGVVEQQVDVVGCVLVAHRGGERLECVAVGDVQGGGGDADAGLGVAASPDGLVEAGPVDVAECQRATGRSEPLGQRPADAARGTGDHCQLAPLVHRCHPPTLGDGARRRRSDAGVARIDERGDDPAAVVPTRSPPSNVDMLV